MGPYEILPYLLTPARKTGPRQTVPKVHACSSFQCVNDCDVLYCQKLLTSSVHVSGLARRGFVLELAR